MSGTAPRRASVPRRAGAELRAAVAFLTRLRIASTNPDLTGAPAFGLVGALVGLVGAVAVLVVGAAAPLAAGALAVGAIAMVTGSLHLDGLGDTFDALAAPDPEAAERARHDPRLGSAGVVAVATLLIVDAALIGELITAAGVATAALGCVATTAGSRSLAVLAAWLHRDAARPGGATWFASRLTPVAVAIATGGALAAALIASLLVASPAILVGTVGGALVGLVGASALVRARRGLDGDGLGACVEIGFTSILLALVLIR